MKKFVLAFFILFCTNLSSFSQNIPGFNFKGIDYKNKIFYDLSAGNWSYKDSKADSICFVKKIGFNDFGDFVKSDGSYMFSTNCDFDFIYNSRLIGYSSKDLKFYEFSYDNGQVIKTPLTKEEIHAIIPSYKIAPISMFSQNTNSIRVRKGNGDLKLFVLNDTEDNFSNYEFSAVNSEIKTFDLAGFLKVEKSGLIKFTDSSEYAQNSPIYVLIIH